MGEEKLGLMLPNLLLMMMMMMIRMIRMIGQIEVDNDGLIVVIIGD